MFELAVVLALIYALIYGIAYIQVEIADRKRKRMEAEKRIAAEEEKKGEDDHPR